MGMFNLTPKRIDQIKQSAKGVMPSFLGGVTKVMRPEVNVIKKVVNYPSSIRPMKPVRALNAQKLQRSPMMQPMTKMPTKKIMPR